MNDQSLPVPRAAHDVMVPFDQMQQMAKAIAQSGLFGMKTDSQALALMLVAQAEGQHPATITQEYDIIQGRAARKTNSVLARFQQSGGSVVWHELSDKTADATFTHPKGGKVRIDWTIERANNVKDWNKDKEKFVPLTDKQVWKNYPRAMLRARCIAEGVRAVYPAAIGGMLVSEEAQDLSEKDVTDQGSHVITEPAKPAELPAYADDAFAENLPKWHKAIASGRMSADDVIAKVKTKHTITAEQEAAIRGDKPVENPAPGADSQEEPGARG